MRSADFGPSGMSVPFHPEFSLVAVFLECVTVQGQCISSGVQSVQFPCSSSSYEVGALCQVLGWHNVLGDHSG